MTVLLEDCNCNQLSGPRWRPGDCKICWRKRYVPNLSVGATNRRVLSKPAARTSSQPRKPVDLSCVYRGEQVDSKECPSCRGTVTLKVLACEIYGTCTLASKLPDTQGCDRCRDRAAVRTGTELAAPPMKPQRRSVLPAAIDTPSWRKRLVMPAIPPSKHLFQPSLIRYHGRLLMAYRMHWARAQIWIAELSEDYKIMKTQRLKLPSLPAANFGTDDPRFFIAGDRLYCEFMAVEKRIDGIVAHVAFAELDADLSCVKVTQPHYAARREWEKNWGFFEYENRLQAVYSIAPHTIVNIVDSTATKAYETPWEPPHDLGDLRGGASPVLHNGEFYSWCHGVYQIGRRRVYGLTTYTFAATPPFQPLRVIPQPLLLPDEVDRWGLSSQPSVVFPCGALIEKGQWVVSFGYHDKWSELAAWDAEKIESLLVPC